MTLDLAKLKSLHAAATQGEWISSREDMDSYGMDGTFVVYVYRRDNERIPIIGGNEREDARCIVALHNAAPSLIARAELANTAAGIISALAALIECQVDGSPDDWVQVRAAQKWLARYHALEADNGKD